MKKIITGTTLSCNPIYMFKKPWMLFLVLCLAGWTHLQAGNILFLVGNTTLSSADKAVQDTLKNMGHVVTVKTGLASVAADTAGKNLIVISATIAPADVGTKFLSVATPVLTWENGLYPTMKMTNTVSGTDFGSTITQTAIKIMQPSHSMAAGLTGTPTVLTASDTVFWGKPATTAFRIAQINSATVADSNKVVIFGYEIGSAMVGQNATGRRVGFFLDGDAAVRWNTNGKNLFRAAVNWAITGSAPYITVQPTAQTVLEASTAAFSVTALGAIPLTYQWKKNGTDIVGASLATYTTPATTMADNASNYSVAITNTVGTITSNNALLTVNARPPVFTLQPVSTTVNENQTASFSVTVSGTSPFTYQWKKGGVAISGATLSGYTTPSTSMADSNAQFTCTVTNAGGNLTSNAATLTVKALLPVLNPVVSNSPVKDGDTVKFSITQSGTPPFTYQWQRNSVNIAGATSAAYQFVPARLSDNGVSFRCIVTGRGGVATSNASVLAVNPNNIVFVRQPQARTVYEGQRPSFSVSVTGSLPLTFQWQRNGVNIAAATDSNYTTPVLVYADSGVDFGCIVTNPAGSSPSQTAKVSVRPYAQFPVSQWIGISAELRDDLGNLLGKGTPIEKDMVVKLFTNLTGGSSVYQEDFTTASGQPIKVKDGFFTLYLGSGLANGNLNQIFTANPSLFAEVTIGQGASQETLSPRTPVTAPAYQGTPQILRASGNPTQQAPAGTYYENTDNGTVWLRLPVRWTQVSN